MSVFTNPSSRSLEQAHAYTAAILALLGSRDPLPVLSGTPAALRAQVAAMTAGDLGRPEAAGKWSVRQVVQHLADSELVWGYRLRLVLAQDRPTLTGYDQDLWAARLGYEAADVAAALDAFDLLRGLNLRLVSRATGDDLRRVGVHAERGEESVAHMLKMCAGHDLLHLRQIERIRQAVSTRASAGSGGPAS